MQDQVEQMQDVITQALTTALRKSNKREFQDIEIVRKGKQIIMPEGMSHRQAIEWHKRMAAKEERLYAVHEPIDAYPLDGALAFMKAIKREFGWSENVPQESWFGPIPPTKVGVVVDHLGTTEQVIWGNTSIPAFDSEDEVLQSGFSVIDNKRVVYCITGQVKEKHQDIVRTLVQLTKDIVREESIYRNRAFRMNFPDISSKQFNPMTHAPKFMDLTRVKEEELIFPEDVQRLLDVTMLAPLRFPDRCRAAKIPLKRGVLLEGPYGTGKTLTQYVASKIAVQAGWTVIYLEDTDRLHEALQFAKQYQPAMVIAEDIDRVDRNGSDRSDRMNEILNTVDGVEMKGTEVMVVLTTNHVERITKAMLRPGRLDAVIPVRPPDAVAAQKLVRLYSRGKLEEKADLTKVGELLDGHIPAVIREVVERAKLAAVHRNGMAGHPTMDFVIEPVDLEVAATGMNAHLALLEEAKPTPKGDIVQAAEVIANAIRDGH